MNGEIIDFEEERSRHGRLFGREDVLAKLRSWLLGERALARGWVLLLGGPGVGKSAIMTHLLAEMPGPTPHHFIRRGSEGWDRPEVIVQNLCAQIERIFSERAALELPSEMRLGDLLRRLSKGALARRQSALVLVVDGLDEVATDGTDENPLPRFLPRALPAGIVVLCASRPMYPNLAWLTDREGVKRIDLDDASAMASNEAACRAFWRYHARELSPPLGERFIAEAVRRARGNMLHATRLRDWLEDQPPDKRRAVAIPVGLDGFLTRIWTDLQDLDPTRRALVIDGLGMICAAREALPTYLLTELLGGSMADHEDFLRAARPFLLEEPAEWHDGRIAYRPYHEHFRAFIEGRIGLREHHRRIADILARWAPDGLDPARRAYALRHAVAHRIEAGDMAAALDLCSDVTYLRAKCRELGVSAVTRDLEALIRVADREASLDLTAVLAALNAESERLRDYPDSFASLLHSRLRCAGWSCDRIEGRLRFGDAAPTLQLLHGVRLGPAQLRVLSGHDKPIVACASTPDESLVLSASADRTLRLWAVASGECLATMKGHEGEITACVIAPTGNIAVSASADATAKVWDIVSHQCLATLDNDGRWATTCAVAPDGNHIVIGSDDGTITVWKHDTGSKSVTLAGHTDYVTACAFTVDAHLVSASRDGTVREWDLDVGSCLKTWAPASEGPLHSSKEDGWISALSLSPDGAQVLAATGDGALSSWDIASGRVVRRFGDGQGRVDTCVFLHDGHYLLCGLADGSLSLWDLASERCVLRRRVHAGAVSACLPMSSGRQILTGASDRMLKLWEIGGPESLIAHQGHTAPITACAVTLDGSVAVSASEDRTLHVWDVATGACRATLEGHDDIVTSCAISSDGRRVLSGARDGSVRLWDLDAGRVESGERHWALVSGCAILPDGRLLTTTQDGGVWLRAASVADAARDLGVHGGPVDCLSVTPDGGRALTVSRDGSAKLWSIVARRCERTLTTSGAELLSGALSPDGKRVVLGTADGRLELRDLCSQRPARRLEGHERRVFACAISPDGGRAFSASEDGTLRAWDLATQRCIGVLHGASWFRSMSAAQGCLCAGDQEGNLWMVAARAQEARDRSPRRGDGSHESLARLRDALAQLYNTPVGAALLVAKDAGLDTTRLPGTGSAQQLWHSIVLEAAKQCRLVNLIERTSREYPNDERLLAASSALKLQA
jgi:WD40 repeat protein